tara:strand:+ start:33573 stop:34406 length:834 start_codon:yes stop_codon:yes gene_type:complete
MTALLYTTGILLALVSGARSVLWLTSYANSATDQALAAASAIGMTAAMYLLSARAALPSANRLALNAVVAGLFLLSIFATFDWAESGYQAQQSRADITGRVTDEYQALLTDTGTLTQSQQSNAHALTAIGHNSKSARIAADVEATISTRRQLLDQLQRQQTTTAPSTGTSAQLLGDYRLALWLLLATLLDAAGMLCLRTATADHATHPQGERESIDPLLEQIRDEISAGTHGTQPAVKRVAKLHGQPEDRIRQIFQALLDQGDLSRNGIRYQRTDEP